jgi:hypothetical protein
MKLSRSSRPSLCRITPFILHERCRAIPLGLPEIIPFPSDHGGCLEKVRFRNSAPVSRNLAEKGRESRTLTHSGINSPARYPTVEFRDLPGLALVFVRLPWEGHR